MGVSNIKNGVVYPTKNFGNVEVLEYIDKYNIVIKFLNTSTSIKVTAAALREGTCVDHNVPSFLGVGFIGYGLYSTRSECKTKKSRAYEYWSRMLKRCYSTKSPDYCDYGAKGFTVCEEWHNFQNFAEWFYIQPNHDRVGYHLDKDLTILGNTVYCPEACEIIPSCINTMKLLTFSEKFGRTTSGKWRYTLFDTELPSRSFDTKQECAREYLTDKRKYMLNKLTEQYTLGNISDSFYNNTLKIIELLTQKERQIYD